MSRRLGDFLGDEAVALAEQRGSGTAALCGFYGISEGAILGAGYSEFSTMVSELSVVNNVHFFRHESDVGPFSLRYCPVFTHRWSMIFASICHSDVFGFKFRPKTTSMWYVGVRG